MTANEAAKMLEDDYCHNRIICELDTDECRKDKCEIWLAIKALEAQELSNNSQKLDSENGDCISRAAAIDAVRKKKHYTDDLSDRFNNALDLAADILVDIPSAQPHTNHGKWIKNGNGTYSCNRCSSWIPEEQWHYAKWCLYCGADMEENKDGRFD